MNEPVKIFGRSNSHFTRAVRICAIELGVSCELVPVFDLLENDIRHFGGHPARKLPTTVIGQRTIFGMLNGCRALSRLAPAHKSIVWPESLDDDGCANAQELVLHCMSAQVQLVLGTVVSRLPVTDPFFRRIHEGFAVSLAWLDDALPAVLRALPARDFSFLEVTLFCLLDHLRPRPTIDISGLANLVAFREEYGARPAAQLTPYQFDQRAAGPAAGG